MHRWTTDPVDFTQQGVGRFLAHVLRNARCRALLAVGPRQRLRAEEGALCRFCDETDPEPGRPGVLAAAARVIRVDVHIGQALEQHPFGGLHEAAGDERRHADRKRPSADPLDFAGVQELRRSERPAERRAEPDPAAAVRSHGPGLDVELEPLGPQELCEDREGCLLDGVHLRRCADRGEYSGFSPNDTAIVVFNGAQNRYFVDSVEAQKKKKNMWTERRQTM